MQRVRAGLAHVRGDQADTDPERLHVIRCIELKVDNRQRHRHLMSCAPDGPVHFGRSVLVLRYFRSVDRVIMPPELRALWSLEGVEVLVDKYHEHGVELFFASDSTS